MGRRKDQAQFNMRLSKPLLTQLQNAAKDQDRSVNSEMIHRLERSFEQGSLSDQLADIRKMLSELVSRDSLPSLFGPSPHRNETAEERQSRWLAMAENMRKIADANDARGAHEIAALGREHADELERDARLLAVAQVPVPAEEPELPMRHQAPRRIIGG